MSRIIRSGSVGIVNGTAVSDADGAPCCCGDDPPGGGGCFLIILACNCDDLRQAKAIGSNAQGVQASWPYADRRSGRVVSIGGVCYRFVAAMSELPDGIELLDFPNEFDGVTYNDCSSSPCSDQLPCDCSDGFQWLMSPEAFPFNPWQCIQAFRTCSLERVDATIRRFGQEILIDGGSNPGVYENAVNVSATGTFVLQGSSSELVSISGTGSARGRWTDRDRQWDYSQTYSDALLALPGFSSEIKNNFRADAGSVRPSVGLLYQSFRDNPPDLVADGAG